MRESEGERVIRIRVESTPDPRFAWSWQRGTGIDWLRPPGCCSVGFSAEPRTRAPCRFVSSEGLDKNKTQKRVEEEQQE